MSTKAPALTEAQWMRQVVDLAALYKWRTYHTWLSKHSTPGWPDLALCRPPRLVLAELKSERGQVTRDQREWLDLLAACDTLEVRLWRPSDFDDVQRWLR